MQMLAVSQSRKPASISPPPTREVLPVLCRRDERNYAKCLHMRGFQMS